jgi:cell division protein FtsW (lipid II flippase)
VLHEHGVVGGVAVLLAYLTFALAMMLVVRATPAPTESLRASRAMFLVAVLVVTVPAVYVALSNVGVVPITGQNMPFLGLNAWSDVTLCAGVVGILITGAIRTESGAHTGARIATSSLIPFEPKPLLEPPAPDAPEPQPAGQPS